MKKVAFIGAGYVGLVNGIGIASYYNDVWIVESNKEKLNTLLSGKLPIYENGLIETARDCTKHLHFTDSIEEAVANADYVFITVGTPMAKDGSSNLDAVFAVAKALGQAIAKVRTKDITVVMKSTVPVGTTRKVQGIINKEIEKYQTEFLSKIDNICEHPEVFKSPILHLTVHMVDNPEFLKEGTAIQDFINPNRIVIGADTEEAAEEMRKLYCSVYGTSAENIIYNCGIESAEMIKYASNSMLAMRISFANMIAHFCEKVGANVDDVMTGVGLDKRIGHEFLNAGCGYGGSCFPKDVQSLIRQMTSKQCYCGLLQGTEIMNYLSKQHVVDKILEYKPKVIALWGATFKPNSDDLRESPALYIMNNIPDDIKIKVYDPLGEENLKKWIKENNKSNIKILGNLMDTLKDADMVVNHHVYSPDIHLINSNEMKHNIFYDIKNQFIRDIEIIKEHGFEYIGVGR